MKRVLAVAVVLFGVAVLVVALSGRGGVVVRDQGAPYTPMPPRPLYDPDPEHMWNRVDRLLRIRIHQDVAHGADDPDPLLWPKTQHLLTGASHAAALALLTEFLDGGAERLVTDPVARALFQRDVWAVFDWVVSRIEPHGSERRALAAALARIIRRVALTDEEISRVAPTAGEIPKVSVVDPYAAALAANRYPPAQDPADRDRPFLPPRLFDHNGPWVPVHGSAPLGLHSSELSRSSFSVLLSIPGGRRATLAYLRGLWDAAEPFVVDPAGPFGGRLQTTITPSLRRMPPGTQVALVRRALVVDAAGEIRHSTILETIQIRVFRAAEPLPLDRRVGGGHNDQDFYEFVLDRSGLLSNAAHGLRALQPSDRALSTFSTHGIDPFEREHLRTLGGHPPTLQRCVACHSEEGLASVRIAPRLFKPFMFVPAGGQVMDGNAAFWKTQRADWGQLLAYWQLHPM